MPLLRIVTNREIPAGRRDPLLRTASAKVAHLLAKPEHYVMVIAEQNPAMLFAGSAEPLAYLELKSIGLPAARTTELSAGLCDLIHTELGIPTERIYIEFADAERTLWGWDRGTF